MNFSLAISEENLECLLPLARDYQVRKLIDKCEDFMNTNCPEDTGTPRNRCPTQKVVQYLYLSHKYGLTRLYKKTLEMAVKRHSQELRNSPEYDQLPKDMLLTLLLRRVEHLEAGGKGLLSLKPRLK